MSNLKSDFDDEKSSNVYFKYGESAIQTGKICKEENYRWFILIFFCFNVFSTGMNWVTISSIASEFIKAYKLDSNFVNLFSLSYSICFPFSIILSYNIMKNKNRIRIGLLIASLLTVIGSILKVFINHNIYLSLIGQFLIAFANPFNFCSSGKISSTWFRKEIRTRICSLMNISSVSGNIFGMFCHVFFIPSDFAITDESSEEYKKLVYKYTFFVSCLTIGLNLPSLFFFKNAPSKPPSLSQEKHKDISLKTSLALVNKNYILFSIICSFIITYNNLMGNIFQQLVSKYGLSLTQSVYLTLISNIIGPLFSYTCSYFIDRTKKFRKWFLLFLCNAVILQILLVTLTELMDKKHMFIIWATVWCLLIVNCIPFFCIGLDYICELTYPINEIISCGCVIFIAEVLGIGLTYLSDFFMKINKPYLIHISNLFLQIISLVLIFFMNDELIRTKYDECIEADLKN